MKKQLIRIFLLFGLVPSIILSLALTAVFVYEIKDALEQSAENQLIVERSDKKAEVEDYLERLKSQVKTYSTNTMMVEATNAFRYAFENYNTSFDASSDIERQRLSAYYSNTFQAQYDALNTANNFSATSTISQLNDTAIFLQDAYISNNPHPIGEKYNLVSVGDYSNYDRVHQQYHPSIKHFVEEFGYQDIFIVDAKQGNVIYSVFKDIDFATSLKTGPYANSGLADAYQQALNATQKDEVFVSDFQPYTPSFEKPTAFLSSPIFDRGQLIGVLIFEFPTDKLNALMNFNQQWKEKGLGDTGEIYLVGPDNLMRSQGRFLLEDKQAYLNMIRDIDIPEEAISAIDKHNSTVGLKPIKTESVKLGLAGETGLNIFDDHRGEKVLSAYTPIEVEGFPWVLLSEIDLDEAYAPIYATILPPVIIGGILVIIMLGIITFVARKYAAAFVAPLYYVTGVLQAISNDIEKGHVDLTQPLSPPGNSKLANSMAKGINTMLGKFSNVLRQFSTIAESIKDSSAEVARLSADSSENMKKQYSETVQIATAITELSASAAEVSNNANNALSAASETDKNTQAGSETVNSAANTINDLASKLINVSSLVNQLEENSESIGTVLTVIQGIAEQTNLLALNAAIEAARAGEQGRGFAVVADEVRTLAARTQDSTKEIQTIIEQLQSSSTEAVKAMNIGCDMANEGLDKASSAGEALTNIKNQVSELDGMTALIAEAAGEQSRVSENVNHNVNSISQLTEETASEVEQAAVAAQRLQTLANDLNTIAEQFKV